MKSEVVRAFTLMLETDEALAQPGLGSQPDEAGPRGATPRSLMAGLVEPVSALPGCQRRI